MSHQDTIRQALARHARIGFQFSGGKDSAAALLLMRPYWWLMTVYFCDSGDSLPETMAIVRKFAAMVPRFEVIPGRVSETQAQWGRPVDILPWTSAYAAHHHNAGHTQLFQDRVSCCSRSIMAPLHERMVEDGITLLIRGQKDADHNKGAFKSGDVVEGMELLYPVQGWTDDQCFAYMRENGVEPQSFYSDGMAHSADCATCTAWCDDDRAAYLKKHHPVQFMEYRENINAIANAIAPALALFNKELETCNGL